jgi:hypothetical protein
VSCQRLFKYLHLEVFLVQNYPVQDWLATDALFSDFDMDAISALAHQLKPHQVRCVQT